MESDEGLVKQGKKSVLEIVITVTPARAGVERVQFSGSVAHGILQSPCSLGNLHDLVLCYGWAGHGSCCSPSCSLGSGNEGWHEILASCQQSPQLGTRVLI